MKTLSRRFSMLPVVAGVIAFLFASLPVSLGFAFDGDRPMADPQVQGYRRDARFKDEIRTALAGKEDLSNSAKNVRVITTNGNVILKGFVATPAEAARVEGVVRSISNTALIENDLKSRN